MPVKINNGNGTVASGFVGKIEVNIEVFRNLPMFIQETYCLAILILMLHR